MTSRCRPATSNDIDSLVELARATFPLACPPGTDRSAIERHVQTRLGAAQFQEWISSSQHRVTVAEDGQPKALLGYTLLVRESAPTPDNEAHPLGAVELSKIYVAEEAHGSGIANELMVAAIASGAELADGPLWLGTNGENTRAQTFYRKHGFIVVGRRTYVVGGEEHDDVVMVRKGNGPTRSE